MKIKGIIKSIIFNYKVFPLKLAIKVPIFVGDSLKWNKLKKGAIIIKNNNISTGMIKIGTDNGSYGVQCNKDSYISIDKDSHIIFRGKARFARGVSLRCDEGGIIDVGNNVSFNQNFFCASNSTVKIGNDLMGGWNITIRDCDGHPIFPVGSDIAYEGVKPIEIGNHVWVGSEVTLMKGSKIPDESIVGWGSLVTHDLAQKSNVSIVGVPAKVVKVNIRWEH